MPVRSVIHASVVSTLWKVDDAATEQFMKRFYAAMLGSRRKSAAAALHEAQEWMRGQPQWKDPVHWAGFTVLGEWRN